MRDPKEVIVAFDVGGLAQALELAHQLDPAKCRVKVGKELFTHCGPAVVENLQLLGFEVFLDLKFHDIPNTVAAAAEVAAQLGVWMLTVHTSGGRHMLEATAETLSHFEQRPLLVGVTLLTSLSQQDLDEIGMQGRLEDQVLALARLATASGLDGVVCSAREVSMLRQQLGETPVLVTPGIRPVGTPRGDQQRVMTPSEALTAGSSYLVIGRPITAAPEPAQALDDILASLS